MRNVLSIINSGYVDLENICYVIIIVPAVGILIGSIAIIHLCSKIQRSIKEIKNIQVQGERSMNGIVKGLAEFLQKIERGKKVKVQNVKRDRPMHMFEKKKIRVDKDERNSN